MTVRQWNLWFEKSAWSNMGGVRRDPLAWVEGVKDYSLNGVRQTVCLWDEWHIECEGPGTVVFTPRAGITRYRSFKWFRAL